MTRVPVLTTVPGVISLHRPPFLSYRRCVDDISKTHRAQARRGSGRSALETSGRLEHMLTATARVLDETERAAVERVLESAPIAAAQVAERVQATALGRRVDSRLLGYGGRTRLESLCWHGANLIPVCAK